MKIMILLKGDNDNNNEKKHTYTSIKPPTTKEFSVIEQEIIMHCALCVFWKVHQLTTTPQNSIYYSMFPLFYVWMVSFLAWRFFFPGSFCLLLLLIHICPHFTLFRNQCNRTVSSLNGGMIQIAHRYIPNTSDSKRNAPNKFCWPRVFSVFISSSLVFVFSRSVVFIRKIAGKPISLNRWSKVDCRNWKWSTTCYNSFTIETTTLPICHTIYMHQHWTQCYYLQCENIFSHLRLSNARRISTAT